MMNTIALMFFSLHLQDLKNGSSDLAHLHSCYMYSENCFITGL